MSGGARTAQSICAALGTTVEEVRESAERVDEWVETMDSVREVRTSATFGERTFYLHQLVRDVNGTDLVVTELDDEYVEVAYRDSWNRITFLDVEIDNGNLEPVTVDDGEPMWGY